LLERRATFESEICEREDLLVDELGEYGHE
jgi:hypothetical protein